MKDKSITVANQSVLTKNAIARCFSCVEKFFPHLKNNIVELHFAAALHILYFFNCGTTLT